MTGIGAVVKHLDGLSVFNADEDLKVSIESSTDELIFKSIADKKKPVIYMALDKLRYTRKGTSKEVVEKGKSVVGRALVGTLIAGPIGTVVGGMSGIGSKKKTKTKTIIVIGYETGGETREIVLMESAFSLGLDKLYKGLCKYLPTSGGGGRIDI